MKRHGEDRHKRSSTLYKYLAFNMEGLRAQGYGTRNGPAWSKLVALAIKDGFTRVDGEPLSVDVVRKVFARADATLAAEERQRRTGTPAKKVANRSGPGWRPPVVGQAPATPPFQTTDDPFAPSPPTARASASDEFSPERLRAGLAEVLAKRSGR